MFDFTKHVSIRLRTRSETWAGAIRPAQALHAYRERMGIAAIPQVISEFAA